MESNEYEQPSWGQFRKLLDEVHAWKKKYNRFLFFAVLIPIIILIITLYSLSFLGKQLNSSPSTTQPNTKKIIPSTLPDPTANWKTYTNDKFAYSLRYPPDAVLYEGKQASADGQYSSAPNSIQLQLSDGLFTIAVSDHIDDIAEFGTPNVFYSDVKRKKINFNGLEAYELLETTFGLYGTEEIGVQKNTLYYLFRGEPSFNETTDQILSTFKFLEPESVDPKSGWKIYTDVKRRFTFQYPQIFEKDYTLSYFYARTKKDSTNMLSVRVLPTSFADYSYKDLGGSTHSFDTDKKSWNPSGFKKTNTSFEAYTLPVGDAGCTGDVIAIPHPDYSYVVEATVLHCANIAADVVKPADVDLTTEEFLKTFTFLN